VTELRERFKPRANRYDTPGDLARALNPKTVDTEALRLIDEHLQWAVETPDSRLLLNLPVQEGKSTRVAGDFPVWQLMRDADTRIVIASYAQQLATRNGRSIRRRITDNPTLGLRVSAENAAASEWTLAGRQGGVFSVGIGGGLTGRPADLMVIDDPHRSMQDADSLEQRNNVWEWWRAVASTRLAPGAPVIVIMTRWHDDDLAGRLIKESKKNPDGEQWRVLNIPAQADHRPEKGEQDPLGREPGQWLRSARGRTTEQWERIRTRVGTRVFAALYQGAPVPDTGNLFPRAVWDGPGTDADATPWRYKQPLWIKQENGAHIVPDVDYHHSDLALSFDLTFADTKGSDYVVGQVWLRRGIDLYLLDQVRDRMNFNATTAAVRTLAARWPQAMLKLVENKANGPAIIAALQHALPGIVGVEPSGSKYARAAATTPFVEAGNIHLPDAGVALFDVEEFIVEAEAFRENATHDDQIDAYSQAVDRMLIRPLYDEEDSVVTSDDYLAELGDDAGYLSGY